MLRAGATPLNSAPRTIAVFRALQLGDLLVAVPALRLLRTAWPTARVTLIGLAWASSFCRQFSDYIDDFLLFPGNAGLPEATPRPHEFERFIREACSRRFCLAIQMHGTGDI